MPFTAIGAGPASSAVGIGLSATSATVIGAAVAAAYLVIQHFRTNVHLYANDVVGKLENPFRDRLSSIVDEKDKAIREGYATAELIQKARDGVGQVWDEYSHTIDDYGAQGPDYAKVGRQSIDNLNSAKGLGGRFPEGFINRLLSDMDKQIEALLAKTPGNSLPGLDIGSIQGAGVAVIPPAATKRGVLIPLLFGLFLVVLGARR